MRSEGTDLERDAVKFTAGFYSMASVITEMSTFSPFSISLPWVPEVFLACGGNFRCWPKADTSSAVGQSRESL